MDMASEPLSDAEYQRLATFRRELRLFIRFSDDAAMEAGLTAQQYQALLAIRAAPKAQMLIGELADHLLVRPNSATELVNRLEALDLVARHSVKDDRRQVRIALTNTASIILESLAAMHRIELRRLGPLLNDLLGGL